MDGPQRRGFFGRGGAEPILVGGGGPVLDAGMTLEPPQRVLAGGERQSDQRQEGDDQREPEAAEQQAMHQAAAASSTARAATPRERPRPPGTATAASPTRARRAAPASSGGRAARSAWRGCCPRAAWAWSPSLDVACSSSNTGGAGVNDVIWGAKRAKARLVNLVRLKASSAAAPWPACRRSSAWAWSHYSGSRPPAPRAREASSYTPRRAPRHRRRPSSRK